MAKAIFLALSVVRVLRDWPIGVTLMNGTTPGEPPQADIGMLAQFMLDAAREDASLVTRAHGGGRDAPVYRHAIPASREEPLSLALEFASGTGRPAAIGGSGIDRGCISAAGR